MPSAFHHIRALATAIGPIAAANALARRKIGLAKRICVEFDNFKDQAWLRPCDSDLFVAGQIFGSRDYDFGHQISHQLNILAETWTANGIQPLIIDAGANVGYSSIFFARTYPLAKILALEIDLTTFSLLEQNTSKISSISPIFAALWFHADGVDIVSGDNQSWSNFVSDQHTDESAKMNPATAKVPSVTLDALIGKNERALLIKLDIEGAERESCSVGTEVLKDCPIIVVEPHDFMLPGHASLGPLMSAIVDQNRDFLIMGENLVLIDRTITGLHPVPKAPS